MYIEKERNKKKEKTTMNKKMENLIRTLNSILKENIGKRFSIIKNDEEIIFCNFGYFVAFDKGFVTLCSDKGTPITVIVTDEDKETFMQVKTSDANYYITLTDTENESILITL